MLSFACKWNWRKAKLARLRRQEIICSPSYVDYSPRTNEIMLLDIDNTLRGACTWEK
jgi:hypothetical protein